MAIEKEALRDVLRVPDLLRNHPGFAGLARYGAQQLQRILVVARSDLVVSTLARKKRPATPNARLLEGAAIGLLSISTFRRAGPPRAGRRLMLQGCIDDLDRVEDARIIRRTQAETYKSQCVRTQDVHRFLVSAAERMVRHLDAQMTDLLLLYSFGRSYADIISVHTILPGQRRSRYVGQFVDRVKPRISGLAKKSGLGEVTGGLNEISGGQERRNFGGDGVDGIARGGFPAPLLRDRPLLQQEASSTVDHGRRIVGVESILLAQLIRQQDRKGHTIHLDSAPMHGAVQPHILAPAAVSLLRAGEIEQRGASRE